MLRSAALSLIAGSTMMMTSASAAPRERLAALLFTYTISDAAKFDAEYRDHLLWHRDKQDHLTWYGWYVIAGARTGMFVDGTFGSDFAAIDRRPDPAGDAEHFQKGAARHSTAVHYSGWTLWPEPSTDFALEDRQPTPLVDAAMVTLQPGQAARFEQLITKGARQQQHSPELRWTWYRAAAGARLPSYLVLMPRSGWKDLAGRAHTIGRLAAAAFHLSKAEADQLDGMIERAETETWRYRADLSLIPGQR